MNNRQKLFIIFLAILMISFTGLLIYFSLKLSENSKTLESLNNKVDKIQHIKPQNGNTPTDEELLNLIKPLIPQPNQASNGSNGLNGLNGTDGKNGTSGQNGLNGKSCTTYTDEDNDSYVECSDGTKTLIPKPDQPRQIELCSTPNIPMGWRYVGNISCQKVKGS